MMHSAQALSSSRPLAGPSFVAVQKHEARLLAATNVERKKGIQNYSDVAALEREQAAVPATRSGATSPSFTDQATESTNSTSSAVSEYDPTVEEAIETTPERNPRMQLSPRRPLPIGTPAHLSTLSPRAAPYTPVVKYATSRSPARFMDLSFVNDVDTPHPSPHRQHLQLGRTQAFPSTSIAPSMYTTTHAGTPPSPGSLSDSLASSTFVAAPDSPTSVVGLGFSSSEASDRHYRYCLPTIPHSVPPRPWYHPLWSHPTWHVQPAEIASWQTNNVSRLPVIHAPQPLPVPIQLFNESTYVHVAQPSVSSPLDDAQVLYTTSGTSLGATYPSSSLHRGPSLEYLPSGYVQRTRRSSCLARIEE